MSGGLTGFAARYPLVWHVIEAEGAGCRTLYPAATLRNQCGLPADSANREAFQRLELPGGGTAILRLQQMPDERLSPSSSGAFSGQPDLWRDHINQHVFFWAVADRRDRFLSACVRLRAHGASDNSAKRPVIIAVATTFLLTAHAEAAFFSRFNTGSTVRGGRRARRDETALRPVHTWNGERAVELAIRGPVTLPCRDAYANP